MTDKPIKIIVEGKSRHEIYWKLFNDLAGDGPVLDTMTLACEYWLDFHYPGWSDLPKQEQKTLIFIFHAGFIEGMAIAGHLINSGQLDIALLEKEQQTKGD